MATKSGEPSLPSRIVGANMQSMQALGRVDNWWYSKVAPVLAISYCSALIYQVPAWPCARAILLIAFVGLCAGSYGHLINDVFDIEADSKAGKRNHMAAFSPWQRFAFCALALALGFAPALIVSFSKTSLLLLATEFLLPTIYSAPPLRLKERGALGLLCDSLGAHLVPCMYVISVLAHESTNPALVHGRSSTAFIGLTAAWALSLGLIGILIHELEDRISDLLAGIKTFATGIEFQSVRGPITILYLVELCAFAGLAAVLFPIAPAVAVTAVFFILAVAIRLSAHWPHFRHYERDSTTIQWWQLSHPYYETYLPLAAAIQCAWTHPALFPLPLLQLAAFAPAWKHQTLEIADTYRAATAWIFWGGRLDLDPSAKAWIWPIVFPRLGTSVHIRRSGLDRWSIRLARPGLAVSCGSDYQARFKIRSNRNRKVVFGLWQDHAPWESLGYCEELEISTEWQTVWRTFTATADDRHGYFGFWLGGEDGSVEVWRLSVRAAKSGDPIK
jgi:4-hydroxybenzoate polyprenyltransferase